jgi:hypothetical protein
MDRYRGQQHCTWVEEDGLCSRRDVRSDLMHPFFIIIVNLLLYQLHSKTKQIYK